MTSVFKFEELRFTGLKILTLLNDFVSSFRSEKVSTTKDYSNWEVNLWVVKSVLGLYWVLCISDKLKTAIYYS